MSGEDLSAKRDESVKRCKHDFNENIEGERTRMNRTTEVEQHNMQQMKPYEVTDDIVHINVGGEKLTTTRSTLCQVEGSLLATMFSGRWERGFKRDQDGAVFFDWNPQYFGYILDYLRTKKIATPENPVPLPKVPQDEVKHFNILVEYLGLSDEIAVSVDEGNDIVPIGVMPSEKFNLHSPEITLQEDNKVAVHGTSGLHQYALGENIYQQEIVRFKLKLESFQNNHWMFVGIVEGDVLEQNKCRSYRWPGSYGWGLGNHGHVWKDGSCTHDRTLQNVTKQGDTVELALDCDAARLSLHLSTGQQFHIDLTESQTWRLNVTLRGLNDKIRIINE